MSVTFEATVWCVRLVENYLCKQDYSIELKNCTKPPLKHAREMAAIAGWTSYENELGETIDVCPICTHVKQKPEAEKGE